jgi:hypothetical protein
MIGPLRDPWMMGRWGVDTRLVEDMVVDCNVGRGEAERPMYLSAYLGEVTSIHSYLGVIGNSSLRDA